MHKDPTDQCQMSVISLYFKVKEEIRERDNRQREEDHLTYRVIFSEKCGYLADHYLIGAAAHYYVDTLGY
jgi:hypothetical protein